jgi:hypothetical protein
MSGCLHARDCRARLDIVTFRGIFYALDNAHIQTAAAEEKKEEEKEEKKKKRRGLLLLLFIQ